MMKDLLDTKFHGKGFEVAFGIVGFSGIVVVKYGEDQQLIFADELLFLKNFMEEFCDMMRRVAECTASKSSEHQ